MNAMLASDGGTNRTSNLLLGKVAAASCTSESLMGSFMDSEEVIGLLLFGAFAGIVILAFTSFVM